MAQKKKIDKTVDQSAYPERPLEKALASEEHIMEVEDRATEDQIKDYHKENPTLAHEAVLDVEPPAPENTDFNPEVPEKKK